jgi:hypothetical protein
MLENLLDEFFRRVDLALSTLPPEVREEVWKNLNFDLYEDFQKILEGYLETLHMEYILAAVLSKSPTKSTQELRSESALPDPEKT